VSRLDTSRLGASSVVTVAVVARPASKAIGKIRDLIVIAASVFRDRRLTSILVASAGFAADGKTGVDIKPRPGHSPAM
jgi:hypothetical protein